MYNTKCVGCTWMEWRHRVSRMFQLSWLYNGYNQFMTLENLYQFNWFMVSYQISVFEGKGQCTQWNRWKNMHCTISKEVVSTVWPDTSVKFNFPLLSASNTPSALQSWCKHEHLVYKSIHDHLMQFIGEKEKTWKRGITRNVKFFLVTHQFFYVMTRASIMAWKGWQY